MLTLMGTCLEEEAQMRARFDAAKAAPGAARAMYALGRYVDECGLEPSLQELVKFRASRISGSAYCLDMHTLDMHTKGARMREVRAAHL
jgi:AhpD family alkylhydroperoxidase